MSVNSLSALLENDNHMLLSEGYGKVFDNLSKTCLAMILKNKDLSGDPTSGSCNVKRFQNAKSKKYGSARSGNGGAKIKGKNINVEINTDKECIEEVEEKDTKLLGVEGLVNKRIASHQGTMERDFDSDFFACAHAYGKIFTTSETTVKDKVDAIISAIGDTKNEYVDGVPDELISLVLDSAYYTAMHQYMDEKAQTGDAKVDSFGDYHGVKIYKSHRMPSGVHIIGLVAGDNGAIAQPGYNSLSSPAKLPLSDAIAFGIFYYYGTKANAPDLIQVYSSGAIEATLEATTDKLAFTAVKGCTYMYKSAASVSMTGVTVGATKPASGWTDFDITNTDDDAYVDVESAIASLTDSHKFRLIEVNADDKITRISNELTVS